MKKFLFICITIILLILIGFISFKLLYKPEFYPLEEDKVYLNVNELEVYEYLDLSEILHIPDDYELLKNYKVNTRDLGKQELEVIYKDNEDVKRKGILKINIVDTTPPYVGIGNHYTHYLGTNFTFYKDILCADNYDRNVKCEIIGDFNEKVIGEANLKVKAVDSSNNITEKNFLFKVIEKPKTTTTSNKIPFEEIKNRLPSNASLLIDVSKWDKDIDWKKVKEAGINYAMIRLGTQKALDEDSIVDEYFIKNIKGAQENGIKVGIYYFSYANDNEDAVKQANWVLEQIKDYDIELPISLDWESWKYFSEFNMSLHDLNELAKTFLNIIQEHGYEVMNYSSKSYLENVWEIEGYNTWLAHYTINTNYAGDYLMWQFTENGEIPGIKGGVDVNFYYNK